MSWGVPLCSQRNDGWPADVTCALHAAHTPNRTPSGPHSPSRLLLREPGRTRYPDPAEIARLNAWWADHTQQ